MLLQPVAANLRMGGGNQHLPAIWGEQLFLTSFLTALHAGATVLRLNGGSEIHTILRATHGGINVLRIFSLHFNCSLSNGAWY